MTIEQMTIEQLFTVAVSMLGIVMGVVGIILTILYGRDSSRTLSEASEALQSIKGTAATVDNNVRGITGQLLDAFLGGKGTHGWVTKMCCSNYEVIRLKQAVPRGGSIYVLVITMDYEIGPFKDVIVTNIQQGKNYHYFLPKDMPGGWDNAADRFLNNLRTAGLTNNLLSQHLIMSTVTSAEILCNITLFNPGGR